MQHIEQVVGPRSKIGVPYGTNASRLVLGHIPAVVFGPGSIDQAHTKDEFLELSQLDQAVEILYRFCAAP
jgi:acetylornithine deacetylase